MLKSFDYAQDRQIQHDEVGQILRKYPQDDNERETLKLRHVAMASNKQVTVQQSSRQAGNNNQETSYKTQTNPKYQNTNDK